MSVGPKLVRRVPWLLSLAGGRRGTQAALCALLTLCGCPGEPPPAGDTDLRGTQDGGPRPDLAPPALPSWHWESPLPQGNNLRGVLGIAGAGASLDELYLVGDAGTLMHRLRQGTAWLAEASAVLDGAGLFGLAQSGSGDTTQLLAVGLYDTAAQWQRGQWSQAPSPMSSGSLNAVWGSAVPGEFYVVGTAGRIYHVRGTVWTREAQGLVTQYLGGVSGTGAGPTQEVWAVGASGRLLHRKDGQWALEADGVSTQQLNAVTVVGTDVYAVGDAGTILHGAAGKWTVEASPMPVTLAAVWGAGDEVFAAGQRGTVLRRSAGAWRAEATGQTAEQLSALWGTTRNGQNTVYAVGNAGTVLRRELGTWTALSSRVTTAAMTAVWARGTDEVYAVGSDGTILRRRGGQAVGAWSLEGDGVTAEGLSAVAGYAAAPTGEADVYAVGAAGTIVHRQGSSWNIEGAVLTGQDLSGVWVGADAVFAVGRGGRILRKQDGKWSIDKLPTGVPAADLYGVWGLGKGDALVVYAVGEGGLVLRRSVGVWAREAEGMTTDTLTAVFGRSTDEVYVVGPKLGALRRIAGQWLVDPLALQGRTAIAGATSADGQALFTVATGGLILRRTGASWVREQGLTGQELTGLSALTADEAFAVGASGVILHRY